jgi:L-histidine Nalpha-methyltransferase
MSPRASAFARAPIPSAPSAVSSPDTPLTATAPVSPLLTDAISGLTASPKTVPSWYLYDALGSALFEAICRLPWYEVTRAEQRLLEQHGLTICTRANPRLIVELGPGSGEKLATLIRPATQVHPSLHLHLVDISAAALEQASRTLGQLTHARITTSRATYEDGLRELASMRSSRPSGPYTSSPSSSSSAAAPIPIHGGGRVMVLFLGSNLGNFDPPYAHALLTQIRAALQPGDTLLLGLDLVKPESVLRLAYDDPLGVTAAFNRNLLARLNGELGADFDVDRFAHAVRWDEAASRIEMHLVSRGAQTVQLRHASRTVAFEDGETIWTESSYKYELDDAERLGAAAGFRVRDQWVDTLGRFALTLFEA